MTLLKPASTALVLVDHQIGTMQLIKNIPVERVVENVLALAQTAKLLQLPVVLTSSQEQNLQGPLLPQLKEIFPEEYEKRVQRAGIVNAWDDKNFVDAVKSTHRKQLVMCGVTTDICLIYPSIAASQEGFVVQAVMDASGSPFELSEELARLRMRDAGVVLTATNTVIAELAKDWSTENGKSLIELLFTKLLPPISPTRNS